MTFSGGNRQEGNIFRRTLMQKAFRQASLKVSAHGAPRSAAQFNFLLEWYSPTGRQGIVPFKRGQI